VAAVSKAIGDKLQHHAIMRKGRRAERLNQRWEKMYQVIAERAAVEEMHLACRFRRAVTARAPSTST
jgi:hypothetical protein